MNEIDLCYPNDSERPTDEQLITIVVAVYDPTVPIFFLSADNKHAEFAASAEDAVKSCRAFVVKFRADILVIDRDSADEPDVNDFAEEFLAEQNPVICQSGRPSGQHLLVAIDDESEREFLLRQAKDFGFKDVQFGRSLRPPGSPHRKVGFSRIANVSVEEAIEALDRPHRRRRPLRGQARAALTHGAAFHESKDRSLALWTATIGMVDAGYTEAEMWRELIVSPGGESLRWRMERHGESKVRSWWVQQHVIKARTTLALSPTVLDTEDARRTIRGARAWMMSRPWKGTGEARDQQVLSLFLDLAEQHSRIHGLGLSARQIAEGAALGNHSSGTRAAHSLIQLGILTRVPRDNRRDDDYSGPHAARYNISIPRFASPQEQDAWLSASTQPSERAPLHQSDPGGVCLDWCSSDRGEIRQHDLFRRGGVTKSKKRVWEALDEQLPRTATEVARLLHTSTPGTIRKHLNTLARLGMAAKCGTGWVRLDPGLDRLAKQLGTNGRGDAQRRQHQEERDVNREKMNKAAQVTSVEAFARAHLRLRTNDSILSQADLRRAYYTFCGISTRSAHRQPVTDLRLVGQLRALFPSAKFVPDDDWNLLARGAWSGLMIVDAPTFPPAPVVHIQPLQSVR